MQFLTEADIRAMRLADGATLLLPAGTELGPLALEYCRQRGMQIERTKPEHMTHLHSNVLVPKTHPRICLRGKLDSLQALILLAAQQAKADTRPDIAGSLEEFYSFAQMILRCEVKEEPLPAFTLLGLGSAGLRHASHHPEKFAGMPHPVPHNGMPPLALALNYLRTQIRETELCAVEAERPDLIEALNRFSSAVYLLFLKVLSA